jgi:hypothetical protein
MEARGGMKRKDHLLLGSFARMEKSRESNFINSSASISHL